MKRVLNNLLLLLLSLLLGLLPAEFLARLALDPVDYLWPELVADEYLDHRIQGNTGGHDAWGFRNAGVPEKADIVCIGDSMTYGVTAMARESWPAVLGKLRGRTVYNMGLGGYGPLQYLHLLRTRAADLHPGIVIVGLYFGNDFLDAYNAVRYNANWSAYGKLDGREVEGRPFVGQLGRGKFLGGLRDWLSRSSVLYVLVTQFPVFNFFRERELANLTSDSKMDLIPFRDAKHDVILNLNPQSRFLDMKDGRIQAAMEIAKKVFRDMQSFSGKKDMRLVVALIPTKERVYAGLLRQAGVLGGHARLAEAIEQEDLVRGLVASALREDKIESVDLLPALEAGIGDRDLYSRTDPHPNNLGYRVVAEALDRHLGKSR